VLAASLAYTFSTRAAGVLAATAMISSFCRPEPALLVFSLDAQWKPLNKTSIIHVS
jgi:hypothetical protein